MPESDEEPKPSQLLFQLFNDPHVKPASTHDLFTLTHKCIGTLSHPLPSLARDVLSLHAQTAQALHASHIPPPSSLYSIYAHTTSSEFLLFPFSPHPCLPAFASRSHVVCSPTPSLSSPLPFPGHSFRHSICERPSFARALLSMTNAVACAQESGPSAAFE